MEWVGDGNPEVVKHLHHLEIIAEFDVNGV